MNSTLTNHTNVLMQEEDFQDFQLYIVCFQFNHSSEQEDL